MIKRTQKHFLRIVQGNRLFGTTAANSYVGDVFTNTRIVVHGLKRNTALGN